MRRLFGLFAMAALASSIAQPISSAEPSSSASNQAVTPAVAKAADFAKSSGMRTLIYVEFDETSGPEHGGEIGFGFFAQLSGSNLLVVYDGDQREPILEALIDEAKADGWRKIAIIVDGDEITVQRGPSPGRISGFNARLRVQVDQAFPGHS